MDERNILSSEEDDWNEQIKQVNELENLDNNFINLPLYYQLKYKELFNQLNYSSFRRLSIIKLIELFHWDEDIIKKLYHLLTICDNNKVDWLIQLINRYINNNLHNLAFHIIIQLNQISLNELVNKLAYEQFDYIIDISRFLSNNEITNYINFVDQLSFYEMFQIIDICSNPLVKHCKFCRIKRIDRFEFHLLQDQVPDKIIRVPGALPIYDKSESWKADDEDKHYRFDFNNMKIYWKNNLIDLMIICDNCLADVQGAIAIVNRNEPVNNLEVNDRVVKLKELHEIEVQHSKLFQAIARERIRRRAKEWAIRTLDSYRLGLKNENDEKIKKQIEIEKNLEIEKNKQILQSYKTNALVTNEKWINKENSMSEIKLNDMYDYSMLKYKNEYNMSDNQFIPKREHPYSWRLEQYDADGIPIAPEAAAKRFGTNDYEIENNFKQLSIWKNEAINNYNRYINDLLEKERIKRQNELNEYYNNIHYIDNRLKEIERKKQLNIRKDKLLEENRINKRQYDRDCKRLLYEKILQCNELEYMYIEDQRSWIYQFEYLENIQIKYENENMFNEELEQCAIDRYWGIDTYIKQQNEEYNKYLMIYQKKIHNINQLLMLNKNTQYLNIHYKNIKVNKSYILNEILNNQINSQSNNSNSLHQHGLYYYNNNSTNSINSNSILNNTSSTIK